MYLIKKTAYGFELTFSGSMTATEMNQWVTDSIKELKSMVGKKFNVLIRMDELKPLPQDIKRILEQGQALYKKLGMQKSAVIAPSLIIAMQMKNAAKASGIDVTEQYFTPETLNDAVKWVS